ATSAPGPARSCAPARSGPKPGTARASIAATEVADPPPLLLQGVWRRGETGNSGCGTSVGGCSRIAPAPATERSDDRRHTPRPAAHRILLCMSAVHIERQLGGDISFNRWWGGWDSNR